MKLIRETVQEILLLVQEMADLLKQSPDFEALEKGIYRLVQQATLRLLQAACAELDQQFMKNRDRKHLKIVHRKERTVLTPFGEVRIERRYYVDRESGQGRYLLDEALGLAPRQRLSPWARQLAVALAVEMPYHRAAEVLKHVTLGNVDIRAMSIWQEVQKAGRELGQQIEQRRRDVFERGVSPKGQRKSSAVYVEADEVWVPARRSEGKRATIPVKVAVAYEGKGDVSAQRRRLQERCVHAGVAEGTTFWEECVAKFGEHWDFGAVERWYVGGDGAAFVKEGCAYFPGAQYRLDPFHLRRNLVESLRHDEKAYREVCAALATSDWEGVEQALKAAEHRSRGAQRQRVVQLRRYLRTNWEGIRELGVPVRLGAIEGQVFHHIARRMKRHGARWSVEGAGRLARLLASRANGELAEVVKTKWTAQPERMSHVFGKGAAEEREKSWRADIEGWLRARIPALNGPGSGAPWVKYVLRELVRAIPRRV